MLSAFSPGLLRKLGLGFRGKAIIYCMQGSGSAPLTTREKKKYSLHFLSISKGGARANKAGKGGDLGQGGKEHFHELPACAGLLCSRPKQC